MKQIFLFLFLLITLSLTAQINYDLYEPDSLTIVTNIDTTATPPDTTYNLLEWFTIPGIGVDARPLYETFLTAQQIANRARNRVENLRIRYASHVREVAHLGQFRTETNLYGAIYNQFADTTLADKQSADYIPQYEGAYTVLVDTAAYGANPVWQNANVNANGVAVFRVYVNPVNGVGRPVTNWAQVVNQGANPTYDPATEYFRFRIIPRTAFGAPQTNTLCTAVLLGRENTSSGFSGVATEAECAFRQRVFEQEEGRFTNKLIFSDAQNDLIFIKVR